AIGRIQQEAGHYDDAFDAYDRLARELPRAPVANEARWRAGWVRYLAGDLPGAAAYFGTIVDDGPSGARAGAAYWRARIRAMMQEPGAETELAALVDEHPGTYYGLLAAERLGQALPDATPNVIVPPPPLFPDELEGTHAARAR